MKIVDLSHTMSIHTPGWVGYAGNKMYYAQNLQTVGIVAQRIETSLHAGTHFDGAMHATDGRTGDMASLPLDYLINHGVVVDLASQVTDWTAITPQMIEKAGADIRKATFSFCTPAGTNITKARASRIWCAISAITRVRRSKHSSGCWTRRSNGSAWTPVPATIR